MILFILFVLVAVILSRERRKLLVFFLTVVVFDKLFLMPLKFPDLFYWAVFELFLNFIDYCFIDLLAFKGHLLFTITVPFWFIFIRRKLFDD